MICKTTEQALDRAVKYIQQGFDVAYLISRPGQEREVFQSAANMVSGADFSTGLFMLGGRRVMVPRVPFMPGSGIWGWKGAVVFDPRVMDQLYGGRLDATIELAKVCHKSAGVPE